MNTRITHEIRRCRCCGAPLVRGDDEKSGEFEQRKNCDTRACKRARANGWRQLLAWRVQDGIEMQFDEIGAVAAVSKQRIEQVYQVAVRKLRFNAKLIRLEREWRRQ